MSALYRNIGNFCLQFFFAMPTKLPCSISDQSLLVPYPNGPLQTPGLRKLTRRTLSACDFRCCMHLHTTCEFSVVKTTVVVGRCRMKSRAPQISGCMVSLMVYHLRQGHSFFFSQCDSCCPLLLFHHLHESSRMFPACSSTLSSSVFKLTFSSF